MPVDFLYTCTMMMVLNRCSAAEHHDRIGRRFDWKRRVVTESPPLR